MRSADRRITFVSLETTGNPVVLVAGTRVVGAAPASPPAPAGLRVTFERTSRAP